MKKYMIVNNLMEVGVTYYELKMLGEPIRFEATEKTVMRRGLKEEKGEE